MANWFSNRTIGAVCLSASLAFAPQFAAAVSDVLETPARPTLLAPSNLLTDVSVAGERIVAVGARGHIIFSDDKGRTWTQGEVPVSLTLTGVHFPTPTHGWAVGHSGVILHSSDGGANWVLQMDGNKAARLAIAGLEEKIEVMEARVEEADDDERDELEFLLDDLQFSLSNMEADQDVGPVNPMLDVWFENDQRGFVIGAYGMLLLTEDGGETWSDQAHTLDNPERFHLNQIAQIGGGALVIVGEAGMIHVSTDMGDSWMAVESPYSGSLFGVTGTGNVNEIVVFGLRGNIFQSTDLGRNWQSVASELRATLNSGAVAADGRVILVGNNGLILTSTNSGQSFRGQFRDDRDDVLAVVPVNAEQLILFGEHGVLHTDARGRTQ